MSEPELENSLFSLRIAVPNSTGRLKQDIESKRHSLSILETEYFQAVQETEYLEEHNASMDQKALSLDQEYTRTCVTFEVLSRTKALLEENLSEIENKLQVEIDKSNSKKKRLDAELDKFRNMWKVAYERYESKPKAAELRQAKGELIRAEENFRAMESMLRQLQAECFKMKCERTRKIENFGIRNLNTFVIEIAKLSLGNDSLRIEILKLNNDCDKLSIILEEKRKAELEWNTSQLQQLKRAKDTEIQDQKLQGRSMYPTGGFEKKMKMPEGNATNQPQKRLGYHTFPMQKQTLNVKQTVQPKSASIDISKTSIKTKTIPEIRMPKFELFVPSFKSARNQGNAQNNALTCTTGYSSQSNIHSNVTRMPSNENTATSFSTTPRPSTENLYTTTQSLQIKEPCAIKTLINKSQAASHTAVKVAATTIQVNLNKLTTVSAPEASKINITLSKARPKEGISIQNSLLSLPKSSVTTDQASAINSELQKNLTSNLTIQQPCSVSKPVVTPVSTLSTGPVEKSYLSPLGSVSSTPTDHFSPRQHAQFLASLKKTPEFSMVPRQMFNPNTEHAVSPVDSDMQIRPKFFVASKVIDDITAQAEERDSEQSMDYQSCASNLGPPVTQASDESEVSYSRYFSGQETAALEGPEAAPAQMVTSSEANWGDQQPDEQMPFPGEFQFGGDKEFCFGFDDGISSPPPNNHNNNTSFGFGVTSPVNNNPFSFFGEEEAPSGDAHGNAFNFAGKPESPDNGNGFKFTF